MSSLNRMLTVAFQDKWIGRVMIGVCLLTIAMLLLGSDSPVGAVASWVAVVLLAVVLFRAIYIGWRVSRGRLIGREAPQSVRRRGQVENYLFGLFFCILLALALWKLFMP